MRMTLSTSYIVFFCLAIASTVAHIAEYDEVWKQRAQEAWDRSVESFEPNPAKIVRHLNIQANRTYEEYKTNYLEMNDSRRELDHYELHAGPCRTTNPIDRCWRCRPNWGVDRFRLADCGMGFGHRAKGGKNGRVYVVTDPSDNDMLNPKPGTLRYAVIQKGPLWITFKRDMIIRLSQELIMTSDKTIDGRGWQVHIAYGAGIMIQFIKNVIIHGLRIHDIVQGNGGMIRDSTDHYGLRTMSDGDGISIFGSQDIWIDHVSASKCYDGLVDIIQASTGITVSNCHFTDHNEALLFGASDGFPNDKIMQVTVAFNHFGKRMIQRMPRARYGYIHVVNNDYTHWNMYAIGGSKNPTFISQGNRYIAPPTNNYAKEVTKRDYTEERIWKSWTWISQGDVFHRGAFFVESGDKDYVKRHPELFDSVVAQSGELVGEITHYAGALGCHMGHPC